MSTAWPATSGSGGAVAHVQHNLLQVITAQQLRHGAGDELVGGAVGAVAANLVLLRHLVVQGVAGRSVRQGLEEGRVKDGDVRNVGHQRARHLDALQVAGVVQRPQRDQLLDFGHHLIGHQRRTGEVLATLHHAVAHSHDAGLLQVRPLGGEQPQDLRQAHAVVRHALLDLDGVLSVLVDDPADGLANALHQAGGQRHPGIRVNQLVLDGGGAGVNHQYGALGHCFPLRIAVGVRRCPRRLDLLVALRLNGGDHDGVDDVFHQCTA